MTTHPDDRKLLRIEARNAETPIERKPEWIKTRANMGPEYTRLRTLVKTEGLHTVCQEAACPNIFECWEDKEATFLIGGDRCTRRCDFCNIDTGKPLPIDREEPRKVAESVKTMGLAYATITGVTRDDLEDEGAWLYAETIRKVHEFNPGCGVEMLAQISAVIQIYSISSLMQPQKSLHTISKQSHESLRLFVQHLPTIVHLMSSLRRVTTASSLNQT